MQARYNLSIQLDGYRQSALTIYHFALQAMTEVFRDCNNQIRMRKKEEAGATGSSVQIKWKKGLLVVKHK